VKVVIDSSVLIAAAISRAGVCAELLEDVLTHHELVLSEFIIDEVCRKLREKFNFPENEIRQLQRFLRKVSTTVTPVDLPANTCRDPEDLPVLGTALGARASLLVSVDKDLLSLGAIDGIRIVKPGDFWRVTTG
jgi:uncharacterized protein